MLEVRTEPFLAVQVVSLAGYSDESIRSTECEVHRLVKLTPTIHATNVDVEASHNSRVYFVQVAEHGVLSPVTVYIRTMVSVGTRTSEFVVYGSQQATIT